MFLYIILFHTCHMIELHGRGQYNCGPTARGHESLVTLNLHMYLVSSSSSRTQLNMSLQLEQSGASHSQASLGFLSDLKIYTEEKPYHLTLSKDRDSDSILTNIVYDIYDNMRVTDVRGSENHFTADEHGFQFETWRTSLTESDFDSDSEVRRRYFPEIIKLLETKLGAREVRIMQYSIRKRSLKVRDSSSPNLDGAHPAVKRPIPGVHIGKNVIQCIR